MSQTDIQLCRSLRLGSAFSLGMVELDWLFAGLLFSRELAVAIFSLVYGAIL
jgi:hypothetical protein